MDDRTDVATVPAAPRRDPPGGGMPAGTSPARAEGVELVGALRGSGYRDEQLLVRRGDGQTFQLTPLLYAVLAAVDGERSPLQIAWAVAGETGRVLSADDVTYLLEEKLRPMGVLRASDGSEPHVTRSSPLLGLRLRRVVTSPRLTGWLTRPVMWLYHPFIVGAVIAGFGSATLWAFFDRGLGSALGDAVYQPRSVLLLVALTVCSAAFHELGHAAACRVGGARPGAMGAALYLIWPVFYTDVTDSYRLSRGGRLRVDLGGLYFNAVFALATFAAWRLTRVEPLLLMLPVQLFQMLRQLVPLVRFDGYHILADLLGVPDLFNRIGPTLAGLLPRNWGSPRAKVLRPWARAVVTGWVLIVVPALAGFFVLVGATLPRVAVTAWDSFGVHLARLRGAAGDGNATGAALTGISLFMLLLPPLSMGYVVATISRRLSRAVWSAADGRPILRGAFAVSAVALLLTAGSAVWPERPYAPTDAEAAQPFPGDAPRGGGTQPLDTQQAGSDGSSARPAAAAGANVRKPRLVLVQAIAPPAVASTGGPPVVEAPAVAGLPVQATTRPAWPFPFAPPTALAEGDNRALAVNTVDGASITDMAVSLVWLTDEEITQVNEALAYASCRDCSTTAAAFQVVFSRGPVSTAIPQNIAVAYNQDCTLCRTDAIAVQLVVVLIEELTAEALDAIEAEWAEVEALEASADHGELDAAEIRARLAMHRDNLLTIVAPYTQLASGEPPADLDDAGSDEADTRQAGEGAPLVTTTTSPADATTTSSPAGSTASPTDPETTTTTASDSPTTTQPEPTTTTTTTQPDSTTTTTTQPEPTTATTTTTTTQPESTTSTAGAG